MANKQQTAVEWLLQNIPDLGGYIPLGVSMELHAKFQQALQMEREQRINAYNEGVESEYEYHINSAPRITAEQYYKSLFSLPDAPAMRELTEQEADILEQTFKNYYKKSHSLPDGKPE